MSKSLEDRSIEPQKIKDCLLWVIITNNRGTYQATGMMGRDRGIFNGSSILCQWIFCCHLDFTSKMFHHLTWLFLYMSFYVTIQILVDYSSMVFQTIRWSFAAMIIDQVLLAGSEVSAVCCNRQGRPGGDGLASNMESKDHHWDGSTHGTSWNQVF